jgi:CheY-like chemotaxis protein
LSHTTTTTEVVLEQTTQEVFGSCKIQDNEVQSELEHISNNQQKRVLIVDNSPVIRQLFSKILTQAGYLVNECDNALECLDLLKHKRFDLLIIDDMQMKSGSELVGDIRHLEHDKRVEESLNILCLTGDNPVAGANMTCEKPVSNLLRLVQNLI